MESSDAGEIKRDLESKSSELIISVPPKGTLYFPNVTISSNIPCILAYREISKAVVNVNDEFEVQLRLRNIGASSAFNVKFTEDWWSKDGMFSLVAGDFSSQIDSITSGENYTISYRLKSAYSQTGDYYIPPLSVTYQWKIGDDALQLSSLTNDLHLMTNQNNPSIYVIAQLSSYNTNFGSSNQVTIKAVNKGTLAAYNLNLGGQVLGTLPAGESWQIITQAQLSNISSSLFRTYWVCSWSDGVQTKSSISNILILSNAYDTMKIPSVLLTKVASKITSSDKVYINMTLTIQNVGGAEGLGITVKDTVPTGFRFINGTLSERNGELTTLLDSLKASETKVFHYLLEVLDISKNYIFTPASSYYDLAGIRFSQISTSDAVPFGFSLILHLSEIEAFNTYNGTGYYIVRNGGDKDIYTMETQISTLPLLKVTGNTTSKKRSLPSSSEYRVDFNYMFNGTGTSKKFYAQSNFFFAGKIRTVNSTVLFVTSYSYPKITMSYSSDAVEGQPFEVKVSVINKANVTLNNITFKVNLPSETKLIEGTDSFQISQLQSNEEKTFTLEISYSFPKDYTITSSKVTFDYKTQTMSSSPTTLGVTVTDNLMIRYVLPILLALLVIVITILFIGRTRKK
jgi:uncharacterized repeat protein (TIGR01451 family)